MFGNKCLRLCLLLLGYPFDYTLATNDKDGDAPRIISAKMRKM